MYAEMGYAANLQKYILSMTKSSSYTTWEFNRPRKEDYQTFQLGVSFQFLKVDDLDVTIARDGIAPRKGFLSSLLSVSDDLFYPATSKSEASLPFATLTASVILAGLLTGF